MKLSALRSKGCVNTSRRRRSHLYLIDDASVLTGQVPIERLIAAASETRLGDLRGDPPIEVRLDDDAELVALLAVERHDGDVAVVDYKRGLIGAIPIGRLLGFCTKTLMKSCAAAVWAQGIRRRSKRMKRSGRFRARMPWLALGLLGGMLAGGVASIFEESLKREVTLAFFLPLSFTWPTPSAHRPKRYLCDGWFTAGYRSSGSSGAKPRWDC